MPKDKAKRSEATCSFMIDLNNLKQSVDLHFKFRLSPRKNRRGKDKVLVTVTHQQPVRSDFVDAD